ncbi:MAG TPA: LysE family transporter [Ignavibacteria bacterium]
MVIGIISGIILGYLLSMPPMGPTNFAIIAKGFKNDIKAGISIGAGAGFTDLFYILIAFGGVSAIYAIFPETFKNFLIDKELYFKLGITVLGCFAVIFYGFKLMKTKILQDDEKNLMGNENIENIEVQADETLEKTENEIAKIIKKKPVIKNDSSITGSFLTGVLLCLSSVTLPASWVGVVSFLKSYGIIDSSFWSGFGLATGVFIGTTAWFYTLVKFISKNSHKIKPGTLNKINISVGIILFVLGLFLFISAIKFAFDIINT